MLPRGLDADGDRRTVANGSNSVAVQSKMARVAIGWRVRDLARAADVSANTVSRLEIGDQLEPATLTAFRSALEAAGVTSTNGGEPDVELWTTEA